MIPEQLTAVAAEICSAALNAVAQLANATAAIPGLSVVWDALTNVINQVCAALGVG